MVQWNIDIADTLYNWHLNVGDIFFKNGWNYSQIILIKPVDGGQFIANTSMQQTLFFDQKNILFLLLLY